MLIFSPHCPLSGFSLLWQGGGSVHLGAASAWVALLGVFIPSFAGVVYPVGRELVLC